MNKLKLLLSALLLAPLAAQASNTITGVDASPKEATAGAEVKITIAGDEPTANCGLRIEYGDGQGEDIKIAEKYGMFPKSLSHIYGAPGTYAVKVTGKKVTTHLPCQGSGSVQVTVKGKAAAAAAPKGAPTPACPAGWMLVKGSVTKDGAFTCEAEKPAKKLECSKGLAYFEKGGQLGCKKAK